jgi:GT2 family glycosyltransferase
MISVVVPTYKRPDALDLCLQSLVKGQKNKNQIIVVVDGFYELNKDVLLKWKDYIDVLDLKQNLGLCRGTNLGVYNAIHNLVLIINDDNVLPNGWDIVLLEDYKPNTVLTPNQIEPTYSMFKQFVEKDLGRLPSTFDLNLFNKYNDEISKPVLEESGGTLPFLINKYDYLRVGGWDENYPLGLTADWEFFLKCQLCGMKMMRTYKTHFYHFESLSTRTNTEVSTNRDIKQMEATKYFLYKWGGHIHRNPDNNHKGIIKP